MTARSSRTGVTLLEVIVSMAIFLLSVIAIFELLFAGTERASDARQQTRTSLRCQGKLAEIIAGSESLQGPSSYTNFADDDPDKDLMWRMSAEIADDKEMLYMVKVWVKADLPGGGVVESQLSQMVLNPAMRGTTFDAPKTAPMAAPTTPTPAS